MTKIDLNNFMVALEAAERSGSPTPGQWRPIVNPQAIPAFGAAGLLGGRFSVCIDGSNNCQRGNYEQQQDAVRNNKSATDSLFSESDYCQDDAKQEPEWGEEKQPERRCVEWIAASFRIEDEANRENQEKGKQECCDNAKSLAHFFTGLDASPNDSSSATRLAGRHDCNGSAMAGFAAAHG